MGKVISHKPLNNKAIIFVLQSSWNLGPNVDIKVIDTNLVTASFVRPTNRTRILNNSPWTIKGSILNLQIWNPSLPLDEIDFTCVPLWVQIHHLPPNRMNLLNVQKLGKTIGDIIPGEEADKGFRMKKFHRIKVNVDIIKALNPGYYIKREDDSLLWIAFKYERLGSVL